MIHKFVLRDNINTGHIYEYPDINGSNSYDTLLSAVLRAYVVAREQGRPLKDQLYITESIYANAENARQDKHEENYMRWSAWYDGYRKR